MQILYSVSNGLKSTAKHFFDMVYVVLLQKKEYYADIRQIGHSISKNKIIVTKTTKVKKERQNQLYKNELLLTLQPMSALDYVCKVFWVHDFIIFMIL